jgi:RNA polymerase sigma-70 factor (ECF subfamily)
MGQCRLYRAHSDGTQRRVGRRDRTVDDRERCAQGRRHCGLLLQVSPEHDWSDNDHQMTSPVVWSPGTFSSANHLSSRKGRFMAQHGVKQATPAVVDDAELAGRALARDAGAFRTIMQRHNRRLYRIARGILRNYAEAEDAVQDAYVSAFTHLASYRGESTLATWLSRIVMNEALGRLRRRRPTVDLAALESVRSEAEIIQFPLSTPSDDPERTMAQRQILQLVEQATDNLPEIFRLVFITRVIEGMSVEETSELLGIKPETVKTRLHRARQLVRDQLDKQIGPVLMDAFPFAGRRCERMTEAMMARLGFAE